MASQGPNIAGTGTNVTGIGTVAWTNPGNITANDSNYTVFSVASFKTSNYLQATNFGFSIPDSATIDGIYVVFYPDDATVANTQVYILKNNVITGTNKASGYLMSTNTFGSSNDKWGETWTYDDINSSGFGVSYVCNSFKTAVGSINYITITVYYTEGSSPPSNPLYLSSNKLAFNSNGNLLLKSAPPQQQSPSPARP